MSTIYTWVINAHNTPLLKKKCSHCNSTRFYCSEKFRTNARKKNIDIWLIYRCVQCSNTYNMTIFSRVRTESISGDLYRKFMANDPATAWECAFSYDIRRKNNVEADPDSVTFDIRHDHPPAEEISNGDCEKLIFTVQYPFEFNLRTSSVIRICLGLSSAQLSQLIAMDAIHVHDKTLQKKYKVRNGDLIRIDREKLKSLYLGQTS